MTYHAGLYVALQYVLTVNATMVRKLQTDGVSAGVTLPSTLCTWFEVMLWTSLAVVEIARQVIDNSRVGAKYPFLPLLLVSLYCACGVLFVWARLLRRRE